MCLTYVFNGKDNLGEGVGVKDDGGDDVCLKSDNDEAW